MVLRSIGVLSCGKLMGTLYAVMGLIGGAFMSLIAVLGSAVGHQQGGNAAAPLIVGVGAVIFLPIIYGIVGFIGGVIMSAIYSVVAGIIGGLELDLQPPSAQL